MVFLTK